MIFNRIKEEKRDIDVNDWKNIYSFENGYEGAFELEMKESTYFSCIKIISESIAKCNLEVKQETEKGEIVVKDHSLYSLLRLRPNLYMSAIDCYKTFISLGKHNGHSGLVINRNGTKVEGLYPVKIIGVTIDNAGLIKGTKNNKILWDWQSVDGETGSSFDKDIIVYKDFTLDGIKTKAIRSIVKQSLDTSTKSQDYLNQLFSNGLTNKLVVQLTSDKTDEKELKALQARFNRIYSTNGRIFTLPVGYNVQALNLSLSDAQFAELRKLSKEEIATTLQVPLSKLGIIRDTAISEEQDNIKFLSDCLQVIITQIEQEMDYKLLTEAERQKGYKIRFNTNVMLRLDSKTQSEVISTYVKNGIYDLDYAKGLVGAPLIGGEPIITFPSGQILLKDLLNGNASYQSNKNLIEKVGDDNGEPTTS